MPVKPLRPIVFTADDRYIKPLAVALAGLKRHARGGSARKVYIFHEGINPIYKAMLRHWLRNSPLKLEIICRTLKRPIQPLPHHFSRAILLRLSVAEMVSEPEFIYLDADIFVNSDYSIIDKISLDKAILAAAPRLRPRPLHQWRRFHTGHPENLIYYASGMLLIHGPRFIAERIGERCLELIQQEQLEYPDQDALNLICPREAWRNLPAGLSVEVSDVGLDDADTSDRKSTPAQASTSSSGIFLQLAGAEKPWHLWSRHPLRDRFRKELSTTPFRLLPCGPDDIRWRSLLSRLRKRLVALLGITPSAGRSP